MNECAQRASIFHGADADVCVAGRNRADGRDDDDAAADDDGDLMVFSMTDYVKSTLGANAGLARTRARRGHVSVRAKVLRHFAGVFSFVVRAALCMSACRS